MSSRVGIVAPTRQREAFSFVGDPTSDVVATAIHAGHEVRPEIADLLAIDTSARLHDEDPLTDLLASTAASMRIIGHRSRFEVDLNRPRDEAVYLEPGDSWGIEVWRQPLPTDVHDRSLQIYDAFYATLRGHLDRLADRGPFLILDVHSYNHRRTPDGTPAPQSENPDVNIGTGSLGTRWRPVVDALIEGLRATEVRGHSLDVRENVRFRGGHLAQWIHENYPESGCAPAIEFKKTFMDERTGFADTQHVEALADVLRSATVHAVEALRRTR